MDNGDIIRLITQAHPFRASLGVVQVAADKVLIWLPKIGHLWVHYLDIEPIPLKDLPLHLGIDPHLDEAISKALKGPPNETKSW